MQHFNDWRRGHHDDTAQPDPRDIGLAIDAAIEMIERLEAAESAVAWHQRRFMALQMHQRKMREPERTIVCDILANSELMPPLLPETGIP